MRRRERISRDSSVSYATEKRYRADCQDYAMVKDEHPPVLTGSLIVLFLPV